MNAVTGGTSKPYPAFSSWTRYQALVEGEVERLNNEIHLLQEQIRQLQALCATYETEEL